MKASATAAAIVAALAAGAAADRLASAPDTGPRPQRLIISKDRLDLSIMNGHDKHRVRWDRDGGSGTLDGVKAPNSDAVGKAAAAFAELAEKYATATIKPVKPPSP